MNLVRMGSKKAELRLWRLSEAMLADPLLPTMPLHAMLDKLNRHADDLGHGMAYTPSLLRADMKRLRAIRLDVATAAAEDLVGEEVMGITAQMAALWPSAMAGDPRANDSITKLRERKAMLLGLDRKESLGSGQEKQGNTIVYINNWREPHAELAAAEQQAIDAPAIVRQREQQLLSPPTEAP